MCNIKKEKQLGMSYGKASGILRKNILFSLVKKCNMNYCFQCGAEIETERELSIEHKIPYLDSENPVDLFFNLDNIAFSHLSCNVAAGAKKSMSKETHPSWEWYKKGCRCKECKEINTIKVKEYRTRKKERNTYIG